MPKERWVKMPEQLPQSWVRLSHAARGFAYDWWRTFRDHAVSLSTPEACTATGTPPRARKKAPSWVAEMVESGALVRTDTGLQMVDPLNPKRTHNDPITTPKSTHRVPIEYPQSTHNDPITTPKSTHKDTQPLGIVEPENALLRERERERKRERESAREAPEVLGQEAIGFEYARRFRDATAGRSLDPRLFERAWSGVRASSGGDAEEIHRALDGWFEDPWARSKNFPPETFARQYVRWAEGVKPSPSPAETLEARAKAERAAARAEMLEQLKGFGGSNANG